MKNIFKKVFVLFITVFVLFSSKNVFSASFNDYINGIKESSVKEAAIGDCKNTCESGYYQLKFGLPFQKMSRCSCVPLSQGAGALMTSFVQFLLSSVGVISVIILIVAGFMMAFAAGNANTIGTAKSMIKNAFIGLIAVIFSGSALAIVNPDLLDLGIFGVKIAKVDVKCIDSDRDKSDGVIDGYYTDPNTGQKNKKNCQYICNASGACVNSTNLIGSTCTKVANNCGSGARCALINKSGTNGVATANDVGVCIATNKNLVLFGETCNKTTDVCAPYLTYTGSGYIIDSQVYCLTNSGRDSCMYASSASAGIDPTKAVVGEGDLCGVSNNGKGCASGYICKNCTETGGTGVCGDEKNNFRCYANTCNKIVPSGETNVYCTVKGNCCVHGSVCNTDTNICVLR